MAFNISYKFEAIDAYSRVARKVKSATDAVSNATERASAVTARYTRMMNKSNAESGIMAAGMLRLRDQALALGGVLMGASGVGSLVSFSHTMAKVKAVSQASAQDFQLMREQAKQLGSSTMFSASQAASGMEFLSRAGFETKETMAAMPAVLDLATASSIGLSEAADITSNIMSGFGMEAKDAAKVADLLAAADSSANVNVLGLGQSMKFVAPVAASMGQSLEVAAASAAALGDAGIQGTMAGTSLRSILAALSTPTSKAQQVLKRMGLTVKDVNPEANSLVDIFGKLNKAGLNAAAAGLIFGREAQSAALVMAESNKKIAEMSKLFEGADGRARQMALIMEGSLKGSIQKALSAFEGLFIALGDAGLSSVIRGLAFLVAELSNGIRFMAEEFPRLTKFIGGATIGFVALKVAMAASAITSKLMVPILVAQKIGMAALALMTGKFTIATKLATAAMVIMRTAFMATPIGMLVTGLTIAIGIITAFWEEIKEAARWVGEFLGIIDEVPETKDVKVNVSGDIPTIGNEAVDASFSNGVLGLGPDNVAARSVISKSQLDANITLNAPPGVVGNTNTRVSGASTANVGLSVAEAGT